MTLQEITKLPQNSYKVVDSAKSRFEPLKWDNLIHILYGDKHKAVRRKTAFVYGLCDGVQGEMPPVSQQGGMREGCGRKPMNPEERKVEVKIWVQKRTVDILGGMPTVRKILMNCITQHI